MRLSKIKAPNTYLFILLLTLFIAILTWIIPGGQFAPGLVIRSLESFRFVESAPQGLLPVLTAPVKGMIDAAEIIIFVLVVGGAFGIFRKTEALDSAIGTITHFNIRHPGLGFLILPLMFTLFSLGGAADINFGDILDYLAQDPKTGSILLYVLSIFFHSSRPYTPQLSLR